VDAARIAVIPNAVDAQRFRPGPRPPELAARFGFAEDDVVIGYISSFEAYEDFGTLVDAIALLRSRGRPVRGLLIGDGPTLPEVIAHVRETGLMDAIALPGRIPNADISSYYRLMDVFVVPRMDSRVSALVTPLKPMEAMASGRAIVVTRLPALMEPIQEGVTGLSFAPGNANELADVLDPLVTDPAARQKLGDAARDWILQERTLERTGERYRQLYATLGVDLPAGA
jgi:glycosyltransferase involved in cell wall biosynthesis